MYSLVFLLKKWQATVTEILLIVVLKNLNIMILETIVSLKYLKHADLLTLFQMIYKSSGQVMQAI